MLNFLFFHLSSLFHWVTGAIWKVFILIVAVFLSIFFVIIPTLFFSDKEVIANISQDTQLVFPVQGYQITNKGEDWLGFELHQEATIIFTADTFPDIIRQVEQKGWQKTDEGYLYEVTNHEPLEIIKVRVILETRSLEHSYGSG